MKGMLLESTPMVVETLPNFDSRDFFIEKGHESHEETKESLNSQNAPANTRMSMTLEREREPLSKETPLLQSDDFRAPQSNMG